MKRALLTSFFLCLCACSVTRGAAPDGLSPMHPCDIINTTSRFTIPRIDFREPTTLKEVLTFIHSRYWNVDIDPPRSTRFVFEYRLPEAILERRIVLQAKDITMIQAIKLALGDVPVALTFEPGKLVFSPLASAGEIPPKR